MWFDYGGSFYVTDEDFNEMIEDVKHGSSIDKAFDYWRITLEDEDYRNALYVEDKIKYELCRRLDA